MGDNQTFEAMSSDLNDLIQEYRDVDAKVKETQSRLRNLEVDRENLADKVVKQRDAMWEAHPEVAPHWAGPPRARPEPMPAFGDEDDD